jgi:transcription antitermination factor NusG
VSITPNWIGYARTGAEMAVGAEISALGIACRVPVQVTAQRRGKRRYAEAVITPALPNYVLIRATPDEWHQLRGIKHLRGTMLAVSAQAGASLDKWIDRTAADYAARIAQIEAGQRLEEYHPGEILRLTTGPFADVLGRFRRLVDRGEDIPLIEVEVTAFGRAVNVRADPLQVRRA